VRVLIDFCARPSLGEPALLADDEGAYMYEWALPSDARKGDVAVLFAAGRRQCYLGWESILSDWRTGRSGNWSGEWYVRADWHLFREPVPAAEVFEATGFAPPRKECVVDEPLGRRVITYLRQPRSAEARAIEGILTESRRTSRSRSPALRRQKLATSRGRCEGCGVDFSRLPGKLDGRRVLTVHHRSQLSAFDEPRTTSLDDLAVLCANCHMLVHADLKRAMLVEELASRLRRRR
jgi:5-methylcytosine-specific restriction endonuclease McrA